MKTRELEIHKSAARLTLKNLQNLKDSGFLYVLVKGYSTGRRVDYIELNYFILTPVKDLPTDPAKKEIYEPIESPILIEWASFPENGVKVLIEAEQ